MRGWANVVPRTRIGRFVAGIFVALGLAALIVGRTDESHLVDLGGVGSLAFAAFAARDGRLRGSWDVALLIGGVVCALPVGALLALAFFVNVVMGDCVYGHYEPGQCGHADILPAAPRVTLTDADSGKAVDLRVGDGMAIELKEFGAAGYQWTVESSGSPALAMVGDSTRAEPEPSGFVGGPVTRVLRFKAVATGQAELRLAMRRPWESQATPAAKTFALTVRVAP